ncbi:MAG: aldehyde dehydrogenase family protein [Acidimicrobiales bacterium]
MVLRSASWLSTPTRRLWRSRTTWCFGLTASIWTNDVDAVRALGPSIETGTVFAMNRADYLDPGLAWTGVKDTGRGITLSALGYGALTRVKSYHLRLP